MSDLTTEILKEIRDESRAMRAELKQTNEQVHETNERLGQTNERLQQTVERLDRLERRQVETEVRLATELTAVVGAIRELKDVIVADREIRRDVADHERRLRLLEAKAG